MPPFVAVLGRTHLLLLHFPIAVLFAALILELALRKRMAEDKKSAFMSVLLLVGAVGSLVSMTTGLLYAQAEDFHGHELVLLGQHRTGGIVVTVLSIVAFIAHRRADLRIVYLPALALACLGVVFTGHKGGEMVHGEGYLTEPLHPKEKDTDVVVDGKEDAQEPSNKDDRGRYPDGPIPEHPNYAKDIKPLLDRSCVKCHGPEKRKSGLRLDKKRFAMKGGETGPAIVPGDVEKSLLCKYIQLPTDDDDVMPSKGKLLANSEIETLKKWVAQGAEWPDDP